MTMGQFSVPDLKQPASRMIYAYWNKVRGSRIAPRRFEIEPARIASILSETFILEHPEAGIFRFRLVGTRICEQLGSEFKGSNFIDIVDEGRITLRDHVAKIAADGCVGLFELEASARGRVARFETILLPLVHTRGTIDRFLGALSAIDPPQWLGLEPLRARRLSRCSLIWPDGPPPAPIERECTRVPPHDMRHVRLVTVGRRQFRVYEGGLSLREADADRP
jgi:hypothetical protein